MTATSPATLEGLLLLSGALGKGALDAATRERIALTVANVNGCDYCNSAHSFIARNLWKLSNEEMALGRDGASADPKANAAARLARKIAVARGAISDGDIAEARSAGLSDAELVEAVGNVAVNVFTNYLNEVFKTPIDFPAIEALRAA
ncbi:MAG: carboxymuconolactone decarboxylase family protein [Parvularculaceae bacterium]|nr:carboxymuconolactone decarboxylase family protein [Parvularculaceae bacterium]